MVPRSRRGRTGQEIEMGNSRARMSPGPRLLSTAILLLCLFSVFNAVESSEVRSSTAYRDLTRLGTRGSNVALKKGSSLSQFWNEKVLGRVYDEWTVSEASVSAKEGLHNFTRAGTIASYLKLSFVDAIYLPVPINFIFVGFDGDGNQGFRLGEEELERWFQNIDHVLEHTRVPQLGDEMTPFYRVKGSGESQTHLPLISYTHYNYSVHGIALNSKATAVFERAIKLFSRKDSQDDVSSGASLWQVDIGAMSHIFQSLINYLQLENAYNIFILNPKRDPSHDSYGYRSGLSASEINFLKKSPDGTAALLKPRTGVVDFLAAAETVKKPLYDRHPLLKFSWTTTEDDHTGLWVDSMHDALTSVEAATHLKSEEQLISWTASQILNGKDVQLASALRKRLNPKEVSGGQTECLVDAWVGQDRWSFIDLSAGPFTWGPAVGGDGVRTEKSLPSVDSSFKRVSMPDTDVDDVAVHEDFQNIWRARFVYLGDEDQQHTVDLLLAEIDVYEMFAHKHCTGRKIALNFCVEFRKRVESVKEELQKIYKEESSSDDENAEAILAQKTKAADLLKRLDDGNIFGFVHERTGNFSVARDSFLAHLGSVLASSMRHVVTPSTADNAFHYYETVAFEIYFITQDKVKDDRLLPVDPGAIKAALSRLIVPTQKSTFGIHTLVLSEDPALAMAFTSAKRASIVPMLLVNGTYKSADRLYLDSRILRHHIKQLDLPVSERKSRGRFTLQIPIFWFLRSSGMPLLVDKHHQAKSMSDMVIVVQSPHPTWESHLHCNGESVRWDLRQPSKAAIAAVAEHMAGLLPSQVTFSSAHENSVQNWLWSVGAHPFSSTSSGWTVSAFQNDAIARNYIVTALDESIEVLNAGVKLLSNERTQKVAFSTFRAREQSLRFSFNRVITTWKQIARYSEELQYGQALALLLHLETHAHSFYSNANDTKAALHPVYCTRQRKLETRTDVLIGLSLPFVVVFLCLMFRPKRGKAKSN